MAKKVVGKNFYLQPASRIAPKLLGKILVRKIGKKKIFVLITETEAYDGTNDRASHASRGRTKRNEAMFDEGGHWYVYFVYGMYWMLNLVCSKKNYPSAVLIRKGLVVDKNLEVLEELEGPGVLSKKLKIDRKLNTRPVSGKSGLWVEDWGIKFHQNWFTLESVSVLTMRENFGQKRDGDSL